MIKISKIIDENGNDRFTVPTHPRLSPEGLFRLSGFGTGGYSMYQPSDEEFASNLRDNILFNGSPEAREVDLSFVWLGKGRVKFAEVPTILESIGMRPATLREALSLGKETRLAESRRALSRTYIKYFIDGPSILYVLGSRDLITVKDNDLFFQSSMEEVVAKNSELLTNKYYWILAAEV